MKRKPVAKKLPLGPTGKRVAANINKLRDKHMSVYELSRRLQDEEGVSIQPSGLSRVERQERKVDVDELVALAVVLGVNPSALLLPRDVDNEDEIQLTEKTRQRAWVTWRWADGRLPLPKEVVPVDTDKLSTPWARMVEFTARARPKRGGADAHPANQAAYNLAHYIERLSAQTEPQRRAHWLAMLKRELDRLNFEVEQMLSHPDYQDPDVQKRLATWERMMSLAPDDRAGGSDGSG